MCTNALEIDIIIWQTIYMYIFIISSSYRFPLFTEQLCRCVRKHLTHTLSAQLNIKWLQIEQHLEEWLCNSKNANGLNHSNVIIAVSAHICIKYIHQYNVMITIKSSIGIVCMKCSSYGSSTYTSQSSVPTCIYRAFFCLLVNWLLLYESHNQRYEPFIIIITEPIFLCTHFACIHRIIDIYIPTHIYMDIWWFYTCSTNFDLFMIHIILLL